VKKIFLLVFLSLFVFIAIGQAEVVTNASGLRYEDHKVGDGPVAKAGQRVDVHYTGWLDAGDGKKGKKFDSSVDRGRPFSFPLGMGRVIRGWDEGVDGMKVGGKRTLYIPSKLGYGARGAGRAIPPNADLIFDVEVLGVN
jgi:FKBP-type peptidyl-prolyl cis-trans isomerase